MSLKSQVLGLTPTFQKCIKNIKLRATQEYHASKKKFSKGQIMSECIYEIIDLPKYHQTNLIDFCPGIFYRHVISFDYSQGHSTQVSA